MSIYTCNRGCDPRFDVRSRCEPNCPNKNTPRQFKYCPAKLFTLTWIIQNENRNLYDVEKGFNHNKWRMIKYKYNLKKDEIKFMKDEYIKDNKEDIESKKIDIVKNLLEKYMCEDVVDMIIESCYYE